MNAARWNYSVAELVADGAVHVVSVAFALVGTAILIAMALGSLPPSRSAVYGVYGACLIATLGASAAYNLWPVSPRKWLLRRVDHACIFLLIAGTYTPLASRLGIAGGRLLGLVWALALVGMVLKLFFAGRFHRLGVFFYLALGWSGAVLFDVMVDRLSTTTIALVLVGGAAYSIGVAFHLAERLRFSNVIWHVLVLVGAATHYAAMVNMVRLTADTG